MKKDLLNISRIASRVSVSLKRCLGLILLLMTLVPVSAQPTTVRVSGKITSATGEPIQGVTVTEKSTTNVTTTDAAGSFSIVVRDNAILVFTHVGLTRQEVSVAGKKELT